MIPRRCGKVRGTGGFFHKKYRRKCFTAAGSIHGLFSGGQKPGEPAGGICAQTDGIFQNASKLRQDVPAEHQGQDHAGPGNVQQGQIAADHQHDAIGNGSHQNDDNGSALVPASLPGLLAAPLSGLHGCQGSGEVIQAHQHHPGEHQDPLPPDQGPQGCKEGSNRSFDGQQGFPHDHAPPSYLHTPR